MKVYQYCDKCKTETVQEITGIKGEKVHYKCITGYHEGSYVLKKRIVSKKEEGFTLTRLG